MHIQHLLVWEAIVQLRVTIPITKTANTKIMYVFIQLCIVFVCINEKI